MAWPTWFEFEKHYPEYDVHLWTVNNRHLSIVFGIVYLVLLYIGRQLMKNRPPFEIRTALTLWNGFMFLFSGMIFFRIAGYTLHRVMFRSLYEQLCIIEYKFSPEIFWIHLFVLTKPIEFIDSIFIVLRKQPLHFLHYYHHCTVVILCWYSQGVLPGPGTAIYYVAMNSFIHTIMYLYYMLRSMRFKVPRPLQMSITSLQILQMKFGCFINIAALLYKLDGLACDTDYESIWLALGIYACFFVLFVNYFRKAYFSKPHGHHHNNHAKAATDSEQQTGKERTD